MLIGTVIRLALHFKYQTRYYFDVNQRNYITALHSFCKIIYSILSCSCLIAVLFLGAFGTWNIGSECDEHCVCKSRDAICQGRSLKYVPKFPNFIASVMMNATNLSSIGQLGFFNITGKNQNITKLVLKDNLINYVHPEALKNLWSLKSLTVSKEPKLDVNNLKDALALMAKRNLRYITFKDNEWAEIPEDMFASFNESKVSKIEIIGNNIASLNFATFQHLYHLKELKLSHNEIEQIIMAKVPNLLFLSLEKNRLYKIPKWCALDSTMPNLKMLSLDENNIGDIGPNSFTGRCLPSIESLSLQRNTIGRIRNNTFATLPHLRTLMLTMVGHPLKTIEDFALNSSSLTTLNLSSVMFQFDRYTFNPKTLFYYCHNLQDLDLTNNILPKHVMVLQEMFKPLQNLRRLKLRKTGLVHMPANLFTRTGGLEEINLSSNRISEWIDGKTIFSNMTNLQNLDLSNNLIPVINKTSFPENILLSLKTINLGQNPFSCTCDQLWFLNWSKNTTVKLVNFDQYTCFHPVSMNGIRLRNYHPTEESCTIWSPIKTMILLSVCIVFTVLLSIVIFFKCQTNIKNLMYLFRLTISKRNGYITLDNIDDFEYHAFVVYCDADRKWVHTVFLQKIESEECMKVCIHHRDFEVGKPIIGNIDEYLQKSRKVVVIMSNEFAKSEWCQWEIDVVQERRRRQGSDIFILIVLKPIDLKHMTSHLRTLLASSQQLQYQKGIGEDLFWKTVVEGLRKPIGQPPIAVL